MFFTNSSLVDRATAIFSDIRERLIATLETLEREAGQPLHRGAPGEFTRTAWQRKGGGGGEAGLLRGRLFEKAGVHLSHVYGEIPPALRTQLNGADFIAAGVSAIIHPFSPKIPAAHMNVRIIRADSIWFGGGGDLTPMLDDQRRPDNPDATDFHAAMRRACLGRAGVDYDALRRHCDEYFYLPHRNESRGVGGVFFDRLNSGDNESDLELVAGIGREFTAAYDKIARRRLKQSWSDSEREQQLIRRGRYVEFNLLHDRGTGFGLRSGGNVEAILSSLPPTVKWP